MNRDSVTWAGYWPASPTPFKENGEIDNYSKILSLAIHEITHTTCNDLYWQEDNHTYPFEAYHSLMKQWAKDCGIKN